MHIRTIEKHNYCLIRLAGPNKCNEGRNGLAEAQIKISTPHGNLAIWQYRESNKYGI